MRFGSLFAGIGGFDLGFERCGFTAAWQVECDKHKINVLEKHWPNVERWEDVRTCRPEPVDLICGGDPCPCRSKARGNRPNRPSKHPDLSGYFLAVVARLRPRWVVRENVPAPDLKYFSASLEELGYRVTGWLFDSRYFTGQSRRREYLIASTCSRASYSIYRSIPIRERDSRNRKTVGEEAEAVAACLTAGGKRYSAEDSYVYEAGIGLRCLSAEECESLQGFPRGWTAGFSERRRRAMCGEAVTVPIVEFIGQCIREVNP